MGHEGCLGRISTERKWGHIVRRGQTERGGKQQRCEERKAHVLFGRQEGLGDMSRQAVVSAYLGS